MPAWVVAGVDEPYFGLWERALPSKLWTRGWAPIPRQVMRRVFRGPSPLPQTLQAQAMAQHRRPVVYTIYPLLNRRGVGSRHFVTVCV